MMFPDMNTACRAASVLRTETAVDAVEVFDRAALRECEADEGLTKLVVDIKGADPGAAALLIECRGEDAETLQVCVLHRLCCVLGCYTVLQNGSRKVEHQTCVFTAWEVVQLVWHTNVAHSSYVCCTCILCSCSEPLTPNCAAQLPNPSVVDR